MPGTTYSDHFRALAGEPTGLLSAEQARERHASGEPYAVTLGDPKSPDAVIDVAWKGEYVGVWFLDEKVRRTVHFSFEVRGNTLFLAEVTNWKYPEGAVLRNQANMIERVLYTPEGIVTHQIIDKEATEKTTDKLSDVDVSINWEPVPDFGDWDSLAHFDRG